MWQAKRLRKYLTNVQGVFESQVSAIPLCFLIVAVSGIVSSQYISNDSDSLELDPPVAERRTFKHKKTIKLLPLIKKHKKFGLWTPHVFGKTRYADIPVYHEAPVYKFVEKPSHEYHTVSAPEPIVESHHEYAPSFSSFDHSFHAPPSIFFYPEKPLISGPALPPPVLSSPAPPPVFFQPQPVLSLVSIPSPPQSFPIRVPSPAPVLPTISFARPVHEPAPTVITSLPPPVSLPTPAAPVFSPITVKIPAPALPSLPAPSPAPVINIPSPSPAPVVSIPSPSPAPVLHPVSIPAPSPSPIPIFSSVKLPAPSLPSIPAPSPAPIFPPVSILPPAFPSFPSISLPSPSPPPVIASLPTLPSPAPALPISPSPQPEFPYPPSGTPVPSYIKDVSLPVTEATPAAVTPHYEEAHGHDDEKVIEHSVPAVKPDYGLFQKFMDWKTDKTNAAFNHFSHFKPKPLVFPHHAVPPVSTVAPSHAPSFPSLQIPVPFRPFPLTPDFRPPPLFAPVLPPVKYESFPPNHVESSPLFNSYGAPIPHDSYASPHHDSHDRLSPEASEEEPSILPPPPAFEPQKQEPADKVQLPETQIQQTQARQEIPRLNYQPQADQPQEQPIFTPDNQTPLNEAVIATAENNEPLKANEGEENPQPEAEASNPE